MYMTNIGREMAGVVFDNQTFVMLKKTAFRSDFTLTVAMTSHERHVISVHRYVTFVCSNSFSKGESIKISLYLALQLGALPLIKHQLNAPVYTPNSSFCHWTTHVPTIMVNC